MSAKLQLVENELTCGEFIERCIAHTEDEIERVKKLSEEALQKKVVDLEKRLAVQRGVKRRMSEEVKDMLFNDLDKLFTWGRGE